MEAAKWIALKDFPAKMNTRQLVGGFAGHFSEGVPFDKDLSKVPRERSREKEVCMMTINIMLTMLRATCTWVTFRIVDVGACCELVG
jgi:hypothetical protein